MRAAVFILACVALVSGTSVDEQGGSVRTTNDFDHLMKFKEGKNGPIPHAGFKFGDTSSGLTCLPWCVRETCQDKVQCGGCLVCGALDMPETWGCYGWCNVYTC